MQMKINVIKFNSLVRETASPVSALVFQNLHNIRKKADNYISSCLNPG